MIKATDIRLDSCPFCQGEVELWKYREVIKCRFICKKCKVEVEFPRGIDSKDCIKKWNQRNRQKGITDQKGITVVQKEIEEIFSETICMDSGPNQFKTIYYKPTCPHGCTDCIYDPAYIKNTYPDWYKKLYGDIEPGDVSCDSCINGERYDDEDK